MKSWKKSASFLAKNEIDEMTMFRYFYAHKPHTVNMYRIKCLICQAREWTCGYANERFDNNIYHVYILKSIYLCTQFSRQL